MIRRTLVTLSLACLGAMAFGVAIPVSAYDFNDTLNPFIANNVNVGAADFRTGGSPTASGTPTYLDATVGAVNKRVLDVPVNTLVRALHGIGANGGGSYVNLFTILMDVKFNQTSEGWASLFNTSADNSNDGDSFVQWGVGLGTAGVYGGAMPNNEWTRLVIAVDNQAAGTSVHYYVNGSLVHSATGIGGGIDGRWTLYSHDDGDADSDSVDVLADNDGDGTPAQLSQLAFYDRVLEADEVADLGPVGSAVPEPATLAALGLGVLALRRRRK